MHNVLSIETQNVLVKMYNIVKAAIIIFCQGQTMLI